jgi:hypothetical protein
MVNSVQVHTVGRIDAYSFALFHYRYGLGALGFSMLLVAIALQWDVFTEHFWYQMFFHTLEGHWTNVPIDVYALLDALYAG